MRMKNIFSGKNWRNIVLIIISDPPRLSLDSFNYSRWNSNRKRSLRREWFRWNPNLRWTVSWKNEILLTIPYHVKKIPAHSTKVIKFPRKWFHRNKLATFPTTVWNNSSQILTFSAELASPGLVPPTDTSQQALFWLDTNALVNLCTLDALTTKEAWLSARFTPDTVAFTFHMVVKKFQFCTTKFWLVSRELSGLTLQLILHCHRVLSSSEMIVTVHRCMLAVASTTETNFQLKSFQAKTLHTVIFKWNSKSFRDKINFWFF